MAPVRFEPTIPASARPQTYALDRAATGIGKSAACISHLCHAHYTFHPDHQHRIVSYDDIRVWTSTNFVRPYYLDASPSPRSSCLPSVTRKNSRYFTRYDPQFMFFLWVQRPNFTCVLIWVKFNICFR
jgi:hypothetical protein